MNYLNILIPFIAWFSCGLIKFVINSLRIKKLAFKLIGYGGMPSNHSAIVSSVASYIGLQNGFDSPLFTITIAISLIVIIDASGLRNEIGKHAQQLNLINNSINFREKMGHTKLEILMGIIVGIIVSVLALKATG